MSECLELNQDFFFPDITHLSMVCSSGLHVEEMNFPLGSHLIYAVNPRVRYRLGQVVSSTKDENFSFEVSCNIFRF